MRKPIAAHTFQYPPTFKVLEYIPKYGQRLADEVRKLSKWVKDEAEKELAEFYPKDPEGSTPIADLWARTITCEGPGFVNSPTCKK
jgi:adenine-specific DNA methylase